MSEFAGLRLNPDKDADIIADLAKYKSKTDRIKEVYRLALAIESKNVGEAILAHMKSTPPVMTPAEPVAASEVQVAQSQKLVWNFPKEPTVKDSQATEDKEGTPPTSSLKSKILSNDF